MAQFISVVAGITAILGFMFGVGKHLWVRWRRHYRHKRMEQEQAIRKIVLQVLAEQHRP
ncbi:MAG TPA: hypothetical protein VFV38_38670 [Ktedonobacteraceae bacterium]|nr:hypothetical protein [Ktedonobacteraceae bacterium]